MPNWKVIITDGLSPEGKENLKKESEVLDYTGISSEELIEKIHDCNALIVRGRTKVSAALLDEAAKIKVVGRAGVGVDNIDLAAAQSRKITVVNSPTATTDAVAEHTLALMLSVVRHITKADSNMKSGLWIKKQLVGTELNAKILGIIGMGQIGSGVAKRAAAFGMKILGYDPFLDDSAIQRRGANPSALNTLLMRSDILTLHLPLSQESRRMINGQTIGLMKRGSYLICAARGGIVDETALLNALESGQIKGAGLDVFSSEPPGLTALVAHPNVVATPHIGAQTAEAQVRAAIDISNEVLAALKDEPLRWKIV
jgi:D-3-phosphoglycerate dehydrogenase